MTSAKRNDQHRPATFIPEDYEAVGYYDNQSRAADGRYGFSERLRLSQLVNASTSTAYASGHQCDHCGAAIRYVVVVRHIPTGDHLAVGETCADGRFTYSKTEFDRMRKAAELDRRQQRILEAWNAYKAEHAVDWDALCASTNDFVQDVLRRGRTNGSISERQREAIVIAVARDAEREARVATEPEVVKAVVPEGRVTLTGTVLTVRGQETRYGTVTKMLVGVTTDAGMFKVWGTLPASLAGVWGCTAHNVTADSPDYDALVGGHRFNCHCGYINVARRGDVVTFSAEVTRSSDDESFGFFSRPTKASIVEAAS